MSFGWVSNSINHSWHGRPSFGFILGATVKVNPPPVLTTRVIRFKEKPGNGKIVAVAASFNDGAGINAGQVRVFQINNGSWSQLGDDIEGEAARDRVGAQKSISLSDDGLTLAVGSPMNDDTGSNQGKVRVYEYKGGSWSQIGSDILGKCRRQSYFRFATDSYYFDKKYSNIVGADINELAPIKGFNSYNFLVAKLAYKILSYKFLFKK